MIVKELCSIKVSIQSRYITLENYFLIEIELE